MRRMQWLAMLVAITVGAWCTHVGAQLSPPMAAGLVVKLKEHASALSAAPGRASVVRLEVSREPVEGAAVHAQRLSAMLSRLGIAHVGQRSTAFAAQVVRFDHLQTRTEAEAAAVALRSQADVDWVMVDEMLAPQSVQASAFPNDQDYIYQTWLQPRLGLANRAGLADVPAAWTRLLDVNLKPITVAVLDSGVLPAPDLDGRLWPGYDFVASASLARDGDGMDPYPLDEGNWMTASERAQFGTPDCTITDKSDWHGLAVTYVLAAATDNGLQGAGLLAPLPGAVVLPVRVAGGCGAALSDLVEGMLWSAGVPYQGSPQANAHPARVLNISFGGTGSCMEPGRGSVGWFFRQTIDALVGKGVLVVASAGNGDDQGNGVAEATRPANCPMVLAVTGLNMRGYKASYANFVAHAPVSNLFAVAVASGDRAAQNQRLTDDGMMLLTNIGTQSPMLGAGAYKLTRDLVGTSFAAPQAAGVAALMLAADPSLSVRELLEGLTGHVSPFPLAATPEGVVPSVCDALAQRTGSCTCTTATCGAGVLDAGLAVDWAVSQAVPGAPDPVDVQVPPASFFAPDRLASQKVANSSGGGGAVDALELLALGVLTGTVASRRTIAALQERQATKPLS
jgi:serine protease